MSSPETPQPPVVSPAQVAYTLTPTWETMPSGRVCTLTIKLSNAGGTDSKLYSASGRVQFSTAMGQIPWSNQAQLYWIETGALESAVPANGTITARIKFNADNNGDYVASVYVEGFGWITHDKDEGGGQWSSQFFPPANG